MKRMLAFMAVSVLAVSTQAASMGWGGLFGNSQRGDDTAQIGTKAWLIFFDATNPSTLGAITSFDKSTGLTNLGGMVVDSHTFDAGDFAAYGFEKGYGGSGVDLNGYWMITCWDPTTDGWFGYQFAFLSGVIETTPGVKVVFDSWDPGGYNDPGMVPEPTAMALLALGAAAVGLRRRFRK